MPYLSIFTRPCLLKAAGCSLLLFLSRRLVLTTLWKEIWLISQISMLALTFGGFYVYGPVHRWSILITVQQDATQSSLFIILQFHCTCFGCQPHPSSGLHKTVTTASDIVQLPPSNVAKLTWPLWREVAPQNTWSVPETVVTVLRTPDNGCGWHPKHVEWTCRIINRLFCVASC